MEVFKLKKSYIQAVLHATVWLGFQYLVLLLFKASPSVEDYATFSGWIAAVILGYFFEISFKAILPIGILYFGAAFLDFFAKTGFFYEDTPETFSAELAILFFSGFLLFISPIIVNRLVCFVVTKIRSCF